uniref:Calcium-activated chloride channel regulator 4-like n=1 Tax=Saccoglossus kowalevskii TaxID=10224 RepID=A0ABM0GKI8_SACKO|nr:PREDICTED: calcium-activated chloride channel regulator 4-like [Saccoglossus kowalevskii]
MHCLRYLVSFLLIFNLNGSKAALPRSEIRLEDNGYKGILIAINENVAENVTLIENLKEMFTSASREMYQATHNRAYMKEITILVPKTWSDAITNISATSEIFDSANIIVDKANAEYDDNPYTNQFAPCGEAGEYIHFTERFLSDFDWVWYTYGNPGKVLVHEWGHLRWGLFDEYATDDKSHFYLNENRHVEPTRCSRHVSGIALNWRNGKRCNRKPENGVLPNKWCRFYPELDVNKQNATGSYMHMNFLDTVTEFCHSNASGDPFSLHNSMAPNQQNIKCSQRSAWDVMSQSPDFIDGNNPPRYVLDTTPDFIIVKTSPLRIVLVLDVSGSMNSNNRIGILNSLATKFIKYTVPDGHFVGIVEFESHATIVSNLIELTSNTTRDNLSSLVPSYTRGGTCIGCGLQSGIQELTLQKMTVYTPDYSSSSSRLLVLIAAGPKEESNITVPIDDFDRVDTGGAIQAPVTVSDDDEFPPSRITDLRVTETSYDDQTVTLEWTAPGNDLDKGAADGYDLRYSRNFVTFSREFITGEELTDIHVVEGTLSSPSTFGTTETVTVQMPATYENITYFFAIRAFDAADNTAAPSNIISTAIVVSTRSDDDFTTESSVITTADGVDIIAPTESESESISTTVIVAASVVGAVVLLLYSMCVLVMAKYICIRPKSAIAPEQPTDFQMSYGNTVV